MEEMMTSTQVGKLMAVDGKTVTRWAVAGKIPYLRTPGGHCRFRRADVEVFIASAVPDAPLGFTSAAPGNG